MLTRRNAFYAAAAGLAALAVGRLARPHAVKAATHSYEVTHTDAEWRKLLTPAQYDVLREEGTERPFTSALLNEHRAGTFSCAGCDLPLFSSKTKFESGTGWPSFWAPLDNAVDENSGPFVRHGPHRCLMPPLRRPSRPRLSRRTEAHRPALLHERRSPEIRARDAKFDLSRAFAKRTDHDPRVSAGGPRVVTSPHRPTIVYPLLARHFIPHFIPHSPDDGIVGGCGLLR